MIQVWDVITGKVLARPFKGHTNAVRSVAFSPDGQHIVSGSFDQTVCVWDSQTGQVVAGPFTGHTGWIWSVAFFPNGQQIVSGSDDQSVRVWDVKTGQMTVESFSELGSPGSVIHAIPQTVMPTPNFTKDIIHDTIFNHSFNLVNGWVKGKNSELLFWLPPYYRFGLWGLSTIAVMGRKTTKLDFSQFIHGRDWAKCHSNATKLDAEVE
jgi:WD40 repeat protein